MIYLQLAITLFIIAVLFKLIRQRQQGRQSSISFLIWFCLWLAILIAFWQPNLSTYLANVLGIGRGADLVLYLSIVVIFYMLFKLFVRLNKIESDITKIVRADAIREHDKKT